MVDFLWLYVLVGIYYSVGLVSYSYISYKNRSKYTYLSAIPFDEHENINENANEYNPYFDTEYAEN